MKGDYKQPRLMADRRRELRAQGICVQCAKSPAGVNMDGSKSTRCDKCREDYNKRCNSVARLRPSRPKMTNDFDVDAGTSNFDSKAFVRFCMDVAGAIKAIGGNRVTIRAIKEQLGDKLVDESWMFEALNRLEMAAEIVRLRDVCISYYAYLGGVPKPLEIRKWNDGDIVPPKAPRPDSEALYGREAVR